MASGPAVFAESCVIVTGGAQGMGAEHAAELLRRGARVAIFDIDETALEQARAQLAGLGPLLALKVDMSDRLAVEAAVARTARLFGGIDALVSNAGTVHAQQGLLDTDDAYWDRTMAVHVGGARNLCRAALPWLEQSRHPRIVIISSMWAQRGPGFGHAYCAAKGALLGLARNLAVELGPKGILVNTVAPGSVATRMAADYGPEAIAEDCKSIPLGRWGDAWEITRLVCFLASAEAAYLTGQTIAINGGQIIAGY
ncbi:SDR family NAD(P)-dependent oxidoreductase [Pseudomonas piscis]|uniref:SDR family NAD(P)-dependent oxidoreductase n=1 Tax=Pseudomonas piscis TaxID=2614538 RepID=UPI0021D5E296|nr:SDR family oxidoreductase [Pseudomonas piscis]MCU7645288.1 SDR family oxidoreductase [Pseudomonas piscis]